MDQNMLTDINWPTCHGTLLLVQEITVITAKTFEKCRMSELFYICFKVSSMKI